MKAARAPWSAIRVVLWLSAVLAAGPAPAVNYTWDNGNLTTNWNDAGNWNPNSVPGALDRAIFPASMPAGGNSVALGANQEVDLLDILTATNLVINGGGAYSLKINSGMPANSYIGASPDYWINADVILGRSQTWQMSGSWYSVFTVNGVISDGGAGYGITFNPDNNDAWDFQGANTYLGETVLVGKVLRLSGFNGSLDGPVRFRAMGDQDNQLILDNQAAANSDRLGDAAALYFDRGGGSPGLIGNAVTAVSEAAGPLRLLGGRAYLQSSHTGASVAIEFSGISRAAGSVVVLGYSGGTIGTNNSIRVAGASNANGIWQPWAYHVAWHADGSYAHVKVGAGGELRPLVSADYAALAATGNSPSGNYDFAGSSLTLASSEEVYCLRFRSTAAQVLSLGAHDLVVGGSIVFQEDLNKTIDSTGGKLIFRGDEIIVFAQMGGDTLTISAPIAVQGTGASKSLLVGHGAVAGVRFTGPDNVGTYDTIYAKCDGSVLELGGPSDRTVTNVLNGEFNLTKSGSGTLALYCDDLRPANLTRVQSGRLVVGRGSALSYNGWGSAEIIVYSNATIEVAAGVNFGAYPTTSIDLQPGCVLAGAGKLTQSTHIVTTNMVVSPGVNGGASIGQLKTANLTMYNGAILDWQLGSGTTMPGTDYDSLRVEGSLVLPAAPAAVTVRVSERSGGATKPDGARFTIAEWTGADPAFIPKWTIANGSPDKLVTDDVVITVDTAGTGGTITLSGLKAWVPPGSVITVQ